MGTGDKARTDYLDENSRRDKTAQLDREEADVSVEFYREHLAQSAREPKSWFLPLTRVKCISHHVILGYKIFEYGDAVSIGVSNQVKVLRDIIISQDHLGSTETAYQASETREKAKPNQLFVNSSGMLQCKQWLPCLASCPVLQEGTKDKFEVGSV